MSDEAREAGSGAAPAQAEPVEGVEFRQLGHYSVLRELGRGAQGVVFLGEDSHLHRKVALKVLTAAGARSKVVRERFQREAEITSKLEHPGICGVHDVGEQDGLPFIAMQFVQGKTLAELLDEARSDAPESGDHGDSPSEGSIPSLTGKGATQDILRIVEEAACALHAAHEVGLVHRDIKPANIMITPEGRAVLLDFGLARDIGDEGHTLTESGQVMGTPAYMSAEQILGDREVIDRRSDLYSLGVTLYECLTLKRPFDAQAFDQLYHQILQGSPPSARSINRRIPVDLGVVVDTAIERDRDRRYTSALEFAEDIARVRAFEPIRAKAPGPLLRLRKWSKRHPGKAVSLVAVGIFVLLGAGFLINARLSNRRALQQHLTRAEEKLAAGEFQPALDALAMARERDSDAPAIPELKVRIESSQEETRQSIQRRGDLEGAAVARAQAQGKQQEHEQLQTALVSLAWARDMERGAALGGAASREVRASFARKEQEVEERRLESERLLEEAREALELAARLEAPWGRTPETDAAFAGFFLHRWRTAVEERDSVRASVFRDAVERHDHIGAHTPELLGRGMMQLALEPADAEAFLFRYSILQASDSRTSLPRLVPVPTSGVGESWEADHADSFKPGDPCLLVTSVEEGTPAASAGLTAGDLIISVNGQPSGEAVFLATVSAGTPLAEQGVLPLQKLETLNGHRVTSRLDVLAAPAVAPGELDVITLFGLEGEFECTRTELSIVSAPSLITEGSSAGELELHCLRDGEPTRVVIPRAARSGLACENCAYPVICAPGNLVPGDTRFEADPGSYLLYVRRDGYEDQRYPFLLSRNGEAAPEVTLLPAGSIPPGFVHIPAGSFSYAGDPKAHEPSAREDLTLPGFFIGRREVTNGEWFEFLDEPEIQKRMKTASRPIYVPREVQSGVMPRANLGGPSAPVMGVSWTDIRDYLEWRNRKAVDLGEPWVYQLPSEPEWEKAARGVDGRAFPWGDRFDFGAVVGLYSKTRHLHDAPGGFEPRDESPYGVQDLGGHRQEWTRDAYVTDPGAPPIYRWRGGSWRRSREADFRSSSRGYGNATFVSGGVGFRLLARPRE